VELHEFITATLVDILRGVRSAIEIAEKEKFGGVVNPIYGGSSGSAAVQKVEFDIAVSGTEKVTGQADAGIKVLGIGIGGEAAMEDENSRVSRIKFILPLIPPGTSMREPDVNAGFRRGT
jgi:hypothetical protein